MSSPPYLTAAPKCTNAHPQPKSNRGWGSRNMSKVLETSKIDRRVLNGSRNESLPMRSSKRLKWLKGISFFPSPFSSMDQKERRRIPSFPCCPHDRLSYPFASPTHIAIGPHQEGFEYFEAAPPTANDVTAPLFFSFRFSFLSILLCG